MDDSSSLSPRLWQKTLLLALAGKLNQNQKARPLVDFWWYLKETFFPGDPFHVAVPVRERAARPHVAAALRYFFPFLEWAPAYGLGTSSRTSSPVLLLVP
uniref:Uncharacterized protein n=2 Tax=Aegilops tauschii subsp. strangulata TaxID=200361 RepID=A0A453BBI7_AEGTS